MTMGANSPEVYDHNEWESIYPPLVTLLKNMHPELNDFQRLLLEEAVEVADKELGKIMDKRLDQFRGWRPPATNHQQEG